MFFYTPCHSNFSDRTKYPFSTPHCDAFYGKTSCSTATVEDRFILLYYSILI